MESNSRSQLTMLVEAACNGELTERQLAQLEDLLYADTEARREYLRRMAVDAELAVLAGAACQEQPSAAGPINGHPIDLWPADNGKGTFWGTFFDWQGHSLRFLSLVLLLTVLFWGGLLLVMPRLWSGRGKNDLMGHLPSDPVGAVAQVTNFRDLHWAEGMPHPSGWPRLAPGDCLAVEKGLLRVTYSRGAVAVLEGPAVFVVDGPGGGTLNKGKLLVDVPQQAVGFTVRTSDAEIVDLGTRFGVTVEPDVATDVHVIVGRVELRPGHFDTRVLNAGSAIVIARNKSPVEMAARDDLFSELTLFSQTLAGADVPPPGSTVLLEDNFDDNVLDGSKWTINTSTPAGHASVTEKDARVELVNRGHLITASQFDPTALPGGITITGQWTFAAPGDNDWFQVLTRSDGVPDERFGNSLNGIMFTVRANGDSQSLNILAKGSDLAVGSVTTRGTVSIAAGDVFDFRIADDGTNVSFTMTEVGNSSNTASAAAAVTKDAFALNHVVFYNREYADPYNHTAYLDNVVIATAAQPSKASTLSRLQRLIALPREDAGASLKNVCTIQMLSHASCGKENFDESFVGLPSVSLCRGDLVGAGWSGRFARHGARRVVVAGRLQ